MKITKFNKIIPKLFREDIRDKNFKKSFKNIFEVEIENFLSDYEYDEIDEFPIEIENRGIMIGFSAETTKTPPQIEYIDFDIYNYPQNTGYLAKEIPNSPAFLKTEHIEEYLTPCDNFRIYRSLHNAKQIDRLIFQHESLRYELLINKDSLIYRVRVCFAENESSINMRTYYLFD